MTEFLVAIATRIFIAVLASPEVQAALKNIFAHTAVVSKPNADLQKELDDLTRNSRI